MYDLVIRFPDQSASFVHGFEAGIMFAAIQANQDPIEPTIPIHEENEGLFSEMASVYGYEAQFWDSGVEGWRYIRMSRRPTRPPLRLVKLDSTE